MDRDRRLGWGLIGLGLVTALVAQTADPLGGPPLYDGVIVVEPYRWLDPPPGYLPGAEGVSEGIDIVHGEIDFVALGTEELPPQAQMIASPGALKVPAGATSLVASITPVHTVRQPLDGYVAGNIYRFEVVDQLGRALAVPAGASLSIELRPSDQDLIEATVERFDGTTWTPQITESGGPFAFLANVSELGDFALVVQGASPYQTSTPTQSPVRLTPTPTEPPVAPAVSPAATTAPGSVGSAPVPTLLLVAVTAALFLALAVAIGMARWKRRPDRER